MDALPENVEGHKVESHEFSHEVHHSVNWSYVAIAVVALLVVWQFGMFRSRNDEDDGEYTGR